MNNFILKRILALFSIVCFLNVAWVKAQDDCSETLSKAQKLYDAGVIEQIPQLLIPCINSGFNSEERLQAQKLIILAYLFDNNLKDADNTMYTFLKQNPEYEAMASDPAEFVQLFQTYRNVPIASIGLSIGTNYNLASPSDIYSINGESGTYTHSGFTYQAGIAYKQYLNKRFDVLIEPSYSTNAYSFTNLLEYTSNFLQTINENQSRVDVPLSLLYNIIYSGKFTTYLRAGAGVSYLISSSGTAKLTGFRNLSSPTINLLSFREPLQYMAIGGIGLTYNLRKSYIFLDLRYNRSFTNQVNTKKRLGTGDLHDLYLYTENDFSLHSVWFSIGYCYKFYKPEKK
jgi:hypothetical protein